MNKQGIENLKDLFEEFLDGKEAEQAAEDIRKGEQILHNHPCPEPDEQLVSDIKMRVTAALRRRNTLKRVFYQATAVAAAVIILAAIGISLLDKDGSKPEIITTVSTAAGAIWDSDDIIADNTEVTILSDEIEQVDEEMLALGLGENGGNGHLDLAELEVELMEINGDFWKG